jgi:hypothetical protein
MTRQGRVKTAGRNVCYLVVTYLFSAGKKQLIYPFSCFVNFTSSNSYPGEVISYARMEKMAKDMIHTRTTQPIPANPRLCKVAFWTGTRPDTRERPKAGQTKF